MAQLPSLFIEILDTPEQSDDFCNGIDPISDDDVSLLEEFIGNIVMNDTNSTSSTISFLHGYIDNELFREPSILIEIQPEPKKTRLIQCCTNEKEQILSCLKEFTETNDIVQVGTQNDKYIQFIVDLSSEECILLALASPARTMTVNDIPPLRDDTEGDTSPEM